MASRVSEALAAGLVLTRTSMFVPMFSMSVFMFTSLTAQTSTFRVTGRRRTAPKIDLLFNVKWHSWCNGRKCMLFRQRQTWYSSLNETLMITFITPCNLMYPKPSQITIIWNFPSCWFPSHLCLSSPGVTGTSARYSLFCAKTKTSDIEFLLDTAGFSGKNQTCGLWIIATCSNWISIRFAF